MIAETIIVLTPEFDAMKLQLGRDRMIAETEAGVLDDIEFHTLQ
jgi:hypothetical protein